MTRLRALAALGLVVTTSLGGCRSDGDPPRTADAGLVVAGDDYVALGDSYTAGPGIGGAAALDGRDGCYRSVDNYPHLVADATGLDLQDVSCGAASTVTMVDGQTTVTGRKVPSQLDALSADTDLVTVRIGGNDFGLFTLVTQICPTLAVNDPRGRPCAAADQHNERSIADLLRMLDRRVTLALRLVAEKAPNAVVLAVGYPAIIPEHGTCSNLPLAVGDYPLALEITTGYNDSLRAAAEATGATYVDVYDATVGHDICGDPPWIAGARSKDTTAAWHPYAQEQQTTADLVEEALRGD